MQLFPDIVLQVYFALVEKVSSMGDEPWDIICIGFHKEHTYEDSSESDKAEWVISANSEDGRMLMVYVIEDDQWWWRLVEYGLDDQLNTRGLEGLNTYISFWHIPALYLFYPEAFFDMYDDGILPGQPNA